MISGLFILALTLISFFLLWKNYSESKQFSLDKLELENQITKLNTEISVLNKDCTKLQLENKSLKVIPEPDVKVEFKYGTVFGNDRARNQRDLLVKRMNGSGYSVARSYALWTDVEDSALQHRYKVENKSVQELAAVHERTVKSVATRLKILNLM